MVDLRVRLAQHFYRQWRHHFAKCLGPPPQRSTATAASRANVTPSDSKSRKKDERVANGTLQNDVRRALSRTNSISMADVIVRARDVEVPLRGSMQNQAQVDQAGEVAKGVKGVTSVRNQIRALSTMGN